MGRRKIDPIAAIPLGVFLLVAGAWLSWGGCNHAGAQVPPEVNAPQSRGLTQVAGKMIYYVDTVKNIIQTDCARCHSGLSRNLMDYDSLKAYADSGILAGMVQGPMGRFAGNDAETLLSWIDGGALEQPAPTPAAFNQRAGLGNRRGAARPQGRVTYENSIKFILAERCLRCHSGPFRNLTTYENVKLYVNNGLLETLVQRGGPMNRFAGPASRKIIRWVKDGAPLGGAAL